ncbi:MAG: hypothetical protein HW407_1494 [Bacteroidetes bacterium]|nr:hypothetical protein [Bacteroidota bacterium]
MDNLRLLSLHFIEIVLIRYSTHFLHEQRVSRRLYLSAQTSRFQKHVQASLSHFWSNAYWCRTAPFRSSTSTIAAISHRLETVASSLDMVSRGGGRRP